MLVVGGHGGDQLGDDLPAVADDGHVGAAVLGDLGRVDVRVHDPGVGRERVELAGHPVVEPGAERHDQVGPLQRADRGDRAVHAGHAQVQRVAVGERAPGHQRGDDRGAGQLGELAQLGGGLGLDHAAADVQHRALGLGDHPRGLADLAGVRPGDRVVAGQVERNRPAEVGGRLHRVLGDVDQHRAGTAGGRQVEGLADGAGDVLGLGDEEVVLGDRVGDPGDVRLLEPVGADQVGGDLAGDRDHGNRVHVGVGQRGDQVGRARPAGGHADADAPGGLRVAGGGVPGALLVADQDVADLLGVEQRVVGGEHGAAGDAEDHVDADPLEGEDERLRPGDPHRGRVRVVRPGRGGRGAAGLGGLPGAVRRPRGRLAGAAGLGRAAATGADRGGAGLAAAVRAGMSSGEGACALEGTGLLCSVIGWLPCHDVRGCCLPGDAPSSEGALKNPSCRVAVEGRAQELDWSALCAPAKYEDVVPLHGIHPRPRAGLPSNYHGCCLTCETTCPSADG